jgi:hypothetical protein
LLALLGFAASLLLPLVALPFPGRPALLRPVIVLPTIATRALALD